MPKPVHERQHYKFLFFILFTSTFIENAYSIARWKDERGAESTQVNKVRCLWYAQDGLILKTSYRNPVYRQLCVRFPNGPGGSEYMPPAGMAIHK